MVSGKQYATLRCEQRAVKIEKFTDLTVWQKSHELALLIYRLTERFPERERFGITAQVRRSSASTAANIAEGFGRRTTRELMRSLQIARGEVEETRYFSILSRDLGHLARSDFERVGSSCDVVGKLINALITSLKNRLE
jgi:four helix bundle protein